MVNFKAAINKLLNSIDGNKKPAYKNAITNRKILERNPNQIKHYQSWLLTNVPKAMFAEIKIAYELNQTNMAHQSMRFIKQDLTGGFMLYTENSKFRQQDFIFFFDLLKDKILANANYKIQLADTRDTVKNNSPQTIERYYLKPKISFTKQQKAIQQYGNINIELFIKAGEVIQLKLLVTAYQDYNYAQHLPFNLFMEKLGLA